MNSPPPPLGIGAPVTGGAGELLGHVRTVYIDNATGAAAWVAVQGPHLSAVVPLQHSRFDGQTLQVPYAAPRLQTAPRHHATTLISYPAGEDLARHYGLLADKPVHTGPPTSPPRSADTDGATITRSQERLRTDAVNVVVGRARLVTTVLTENQTLTVPVRRQVVRLVYDPIPEHEQVISPTEPAEELVEVILHAEQVEITTRVVPVECVRMVRRVVTTGQSITEWVRSEQITLEQTDLTGPGPGDNQEKTP